MTNETDRAHISTGYAKLMLIVGQCELTTALFHHNDSKINDRHIIDNISDYFYDVKTFTSALPSLLLLSISLTQI